MLQFKKAVKERIKLRLALFGPSGSGKTYSALAIAEGMGGKVAVIDTEHGSASIYSDRFEFDVCQLDDDKSIDTVCEAIRLASSDHDIVIIDSFTHPWQDLLQEIDKLANSKFKGNTWSAWSAGTPKQQKLVNALLSCRSHVIATMRSKTEWNIEKDDKSGRTKPVRIGLSPEQGKGIEYEFTMLGEISTSHIMEVIKDRSGKFQDKLIEKPGVEFGNELIKWLNEGTVVVKEETKKEPVKEETKESKPSENDDIPEPNDDEAMFIGDVLNRLEVANPDKTVNRMQLKRILWAPKQSYPTDISKAEATAGWILKDKERCFFVFEE